MKKLTFILALSFFIGVVFTSCKPKEPEPNWYALDWECVVCGWVYHYVDGCPEQGIAPGTEWDDVPWDFVCPVCGMDKDGFLPERY